MANPLPLPVWDRQRGKLVKEWMEDHQPHYESEPQRSLIQWIKSRPLYDRLYALYENSRWSTREIDVFGALLAVLNRAPARSGCRAFRAQKADRR
jgi:phosphatidylserine decarboxylase